jgi:hypothetical protein
VARRAAAAGEPDFTKVAFRGWVEATRGRPRFTEADRSAFAGELEIAYSEARGYPSTGLLLELTKDPYHRARALAAIGNGQAGATRGNEKRVAKKPNDAAKSLNSALIATNSISDPEQKCRVLAAVFEGFYRTGDRETGKSMADVAIDMVRQVEESRRPKVIEEIAAALVRSGEVDLGLEQARRIPVPPFLPLAADSDRATPEIQKRYEVAALGAAKLRADAISSAFRALTHTAGVKPGEQAMAASLQAANDEGMNDDRSYSLTHAALAKGYARRGDFRTPCDWYPEMYRTSVDKLDVSGTLFAEFESQKPARSNLGEAGAKSSNLSQHP